MKNNSNVPIEYRAYLESKNESSKRESEFKRFQNLNNLNYKSIIGKIFNLRKLIFYYF